jgi:hypothetical protein
MMHCSLGHAALWDSCQGVIRPNLRRKEATPLSFTPYNSAADGAHRIGASNGDVRLAVSVSDVCPLVSPQGGRDLDLKHDDVLSLSCGDGDVVRYSPAMDTLPGRL